MYQYQYTSTNQVHTKNTVLVPLVTIPDEYLWYIPYIYHVYYIFRYMYGIYHTYTLYIELFICFSFSYSHDCWEPISWVSRRQCIRQKNFKKHIYASNAVYMNIWYMYGKSKTYVWYIPYIYQV